MQSLPIFTGGTLWASASRWPWQAPIGTAPLNPSGARFGGGWDCALGLRFGWPTRFGFSVLFELGFGIVQIGYRTRAWALRDSERRAALAAAYQTKIKGA